MSGGLDLVHVGYVSSHTMLFSIALPIAIITLEIYVTERKLMPLISRS